MAAPGEPSRHRIGPGLRVGHLTVTGKAGVRRWSCRCDCGRDVIVEAARIRRGTATACGMCDYPIIRKPRTGTALGHQSTTDKALYDLWAHLHTAGRLDPAWQYYPVFSKWAYTHGWRPGMSIDPGTTDGTFTPAASSVTAPYKSRRFIKPGMWKPVTRTGGGKPARTWRSLTEAAADLIAHGEGHKDGDLSATLSGISRAARGGRRTHRAYGYEWHYPDG